MGYACERGVRGRETVLSQTNLILEINRVLCRNLHYHQNLEISTFIGFHYKAFHAPVVENVKFGYSTPHVRASFKSLTSSSQSRFRH